MIKQVKKYSVIALTMFVFLAFNSISVFAADDSVLSLGTRTITDVNKTWTVTFSSPIDFSSVLGNIQIKDVTSGNNLSITPMQGDSKAIVKVDAPSGGYILGHTYQVTVNKNIKLLSGNSLARTTTLNFIVTSKANSTSSGYAISANVTVSPAISIFKQITITSTNLPDAAKCKIEGNNNLVDIGKSIFLVVPGNTVKVYIYDSKGNVIGTADLDVSTTKNNMSLNLK
ncbi:Ig-like domain-containing protein [Clostridium sp. P21]|uniref:Ig-like domain-containing protein n=1 Tax=Clostridium muellerianum TaxID=2716538 RepID=A0A7Y0EDN6_9CLOT|nr:Ig-like domain-containing protein [Clostridium muellerianum]NMM61463.1 Ig-like domain-containing protein [Clostridium muellerianum]